MSRLFKRTKLAITSSVIAMGLMTAAANAAIVSIQKASGTPIGVQSIQSTVNGGDMAGMTVIARFADGTNFGGSWVDDGGGSGSVTTSAFSLSATGNTFGDNAWSFTTRTRSSLVGLSMFGGGVGFDSTSPSPGTVDSASGKDFATGIAGVGTIIAAYTNNIVLTGNNPQRDIFGRIDIDFRGFSNQLLQTVCIDDCGPQGGLLGNFSFTQDTDLTPVPIPAPLALFLTGLAGLGFIARRRRKS